ncbi:phage major capsid protein [Flavobacterium pectinovorum]|uniref:AbiTii domain-containing protein n=1 Tax=Flavobacterium pectinovorum TaxID=29533 RepID=A0A502E2C9_9FLAO|nr:phage major capsid protein [Flavobacterium pectinovorum]TPG31109.1 hypothetical protein EAH81_27215 [Flavobacterium pectinovorum]
MKLISDIINDLVDNDKSLNSALLKTKVLASRIKNKDLSEWVSKESNGYNSEKELPSYRKNISCHIKGDYIVGNMKYSNQAVPIVGMEETFKSSLSQTNFTISILALESLTSDSKSSTLMYPFPAEIIGMIEENWIQMGNPYLRLINARKIIPTTAVKEILVQVRNKLLDFMLEIDSEYGNLTEIKDLSEKSKEISKIMNQTIINNTGDGNILSTGTNAKINAKINISKGGLDELKNHLNEIGISEIDANELIEIIDEDKPNYENGTFGDKTNKWIQKMLGKTLDGTWQVGIGTAGTLLAEGIKAYLGM